MDFAPLDMNDTNDNASKTKKKQFIKNIIPMSLKMIPTIKLA